MVGCRRMCYLPVHSAVAECRESLMTQCVMHANAIAQCTPHNIWIDAYRHACVCQMHVCPCILEIRNLKHRWTTLN